MRAGSRNFLPMTVQIMILPEVRAPSEHFAGWKLALAQKQKTESQAKAEGDEKASRPRAAPAAVDERTTPTRPARPTLTRPPRHSRAAACRAARRRHRPPPARGAGPGGGGCPIHGTCLDRCQIKIAKKTNVCMEY